MQKHFWRSNYSFTYVALGVLGFLLPTRNWYEVVVRVVFILIGLFLLTTWRNRKRAIYILVGGITVLVFWIVAATISIVLHWADVFYRIHLFYMPLWTFFAVQHYKAIRELTIELNLEKDGQEKHG